MQSESKQIYEITSRRTGTSESLYTDIGNFVFKELNSHLSSPKSLISKLKGVGTWYLRKKRIQKFLAKAPPEGKGAEEFHMKRSYEIYLEQMEIKMILEERMKEYEKYLIEKSEVRQKRNETQTLLSGTNREE